MGSETKWQCDKCGQRGDVWEGCALAECRAYKPVELRLRPPPTPTADGEAVQVGARHKVTVGAWSVPALKGPRYSIFDIDAGREVFACAMASQVAGWMNRHAEWYPTDEEMASLLALRARPALPAEPE